MDLVAAARGGNVFRVRHELGQPLLRLLLRCARNIAALVTAGETDPPPRSPAGTSSQRPISLAERSTMRLTRKQQFPLMTRSGH